MTNFADDGESFAAGDVPIEDVDWDEVERLEGLINRVKRSPDVSTRTMGMASLLVEMYGESLDLR